MTPPSRLAVVMVKASTRVLPRGPVRDRYEQELVAELHQLEGSGQLPYAARVLARAWRLRRAVVSGEVSGTGQLNPPLHCRLHLYHHYRRAFTEDGRRYRQCHDCGQDQPGTGGGPADAWSAVSMRPHN